MATEQAESSGSWSHSSFALDYSGDTFESFSEEEEEESEAPESCSTEDLEEAAVSEALEISSSLPGQSPAGLLSSPCLRPVFHSFKKCSGDLNLQK